MHYIADSARPPGFARDIRPLFRDEDVDAMAFSMDLTSYDDVRDNADAIAERIGEGSMPCDGPWDDTRIALFEAWRSGGLLP